MRMRFAPAAAALVLAALGLVRPALADDAPNIAAARALGTEGMRLANAGDCAAAIDKLDRAEKLHHALSTLARLGECHIELGHLVAGSEMLIRVMREPLAADAPQAFVAARLRAPKILEETRPRIGAVHIVIDAPQDAKPVVTFDGEPMDRALLDVDRPTDPGSHVVLAQATGYKKATASVSLKDGEKTTVKLTLERDPSVPLARPEERPAEPAPAIDQSSRSDRPAASAAPSSGRRTLGYAVLAIGGAAVITGGVFGLLAIGSKSSLDDACKDKACPPEQDRKISSLKTQSTLSTIFVAAGGAVAAGGLVLVLTAPNAPATTALHVGPGSIALERRF